MANTVTSRTIDTDRLGTHFLEAGDPKGVPVIFIHGNCSSSRFFQATLEALPAGYRGLALDLRGYGHSQAKPADATRGMGDYSDDLHAFLQALKLDDQKVHLVGWSVGAMVAMQYTMDHPKLVASLVFESAGSPFGFGGTKDAKGTPNFADFAGSGGGTANPDFVERLKTKDRSGDSPNSPRNVMNAFYFKPPFRSPEEEALLDAMNTTHVADGNYPGDLTKSPNWPTVAPGTGGMNNAISPKYLNLSGFAAVASKPDVLWIRGADDQIVSDTSLFDFGFLGQIGAVPGWPGAELYPPQPMVTQVRYVLDAYKQNGGRYEEKVLPECGHSPHIEKAEEFRAAVFGFIGEHR